MTEDRLIELIEAYGADPAAWPAAERDAGAAMLAGPSARVRAALEEATALDRQMAALGTPEPPARLHAAVLDAAPRPARGRRAGWLGILPRPGWPAGAAFASLLAGFFMGATVAAEPASTVPGESAVYAALGLDAYGVAFLEERE